MDEERLQEMPEQPASQEEKKYLPRPGWQVWAARIGLVVVLIAVALYYYHIAKGG